MKIYIKNITYILVLIIASHSLEGSYNSLDEFDDLELESLDYPKKRKRNSSDDKQRLILFDDNLYLLDDDFDFGSDEIELRKLELNPSDMETAKEYEDFLNVFFENSLPLGNSFQSLNSSSSGYQKQEFTNSRNSSQGFQTPSNRRSKSSSPRYQNPGQQNAPRSGGGQKGKLGIGISTILGATIPMGQNLKANFSSGSNFGIHIDSPLSFNLAGKEARLGSDIYFSSMTANKSGGSPYKLANINGTISLFLNKSIELKTGLGLTPANIGDFSKTLFSLPVDLNYYLPFEVGGFGIALNLHAQETLGIPTDMGTPDTEGTSEFINVGFFITTPLTF
mgnify:CR=1 FL=1